MNNTDYIESNENNYVKPDILFSENKTANFKPWQRHFMYLGFLTHVANDLYNRKCKAQY